MPLLPPVDYMAPVPLKRKRDMSAEPEDRSPGANIHARTRRGEAGQEGGQTLRRVLLGSRVQL